jgi:DNA-binding MarR family transcriptional regulator
VIGTRKAARRPAPPGAEAWLLMWEVSRASKPHLEMLAADFDLTPQLVWALKLLAVEPSRTMSELAEQLGCDASNVTSIVDRLEARGFVERRASVLDRRVKALVLTPEGDRVRAGIEERMLQPPPAIANLAVEDQRSLRDILRRALDAFEAGDSARPHRP